MKKFSSITRANSHHTSRNKKLQTILIVGAVMLILLFAVPSLVSFAASLVVSPVHVVKTWIAHSSGSLPQYLRDRDALIEEISALKFSQASQSGEQFTVQLLTQENEELRQLLGDEGEKRIAAGIIGRPNKLPYDVLVIDKGSNDGIVEGAPVFISDSTVIGSVAKAFPKSAVVELITTPGFVASVFIAGPDIYTNAEGIGGGQLRVGVPQGIELSVGDLVILPSIDSGVYGAISVVDSVPTQPQQYGYVSPEIPLNSLHFVSVGDSPMEPVDFDKAQAIVEATKNEAFVVPIPENILITTNGSSTATSTATSTSATSTVLLP